MRTSITTGIPRLIPNTRHAAIKRGSPHSFRRTAIRPKHSARNCFVNAAAGGAVVIERAHSVKMHTQLKGRVEEASKARPRFPPPSFLALLLEFPSFRRFQRTVTVFTIIVVSLQGFARASVEQWIRALDEATFNQGFQGHLAWRVVAFFTVAYFFGTGRMWCCRTGCKLSIASNLFALGEYGSLNFIAFPCVASFSKTLFSK